MSPKITFNRRGFRPTFSIIRPTPSWILISEEPRYGTVEYLSAGYEEMEVFEIGVRSDGYTERGITTISGYLTVHFPTKDPPDNFILIIKDRVVTGCVFVEYDVEALSDNMYQHSGRFSAAKIYRLPTVLVLNQESQNKSTPEQINENVFDIDRFEVESQQLSVGSNGKIYVYSAVLRPKSVIEMD